jgi:ParB-like chromosome segregation protein Spo0J
MSKDDIGSMIRTATKNISGGQQLSQSEQAIVSNLAISMRESQRNWQPIFVRETGLYQFQLIGSSLILEAAKLAGLEVVYCIQVDESENTSQDIINIQNTIQGTGGESVMDLSPLLRRIDQLDDTINNFNHWY